MTTDHDEVSRLIAEVSQLPTEAREAVILGAMLADLSAEARRPIVAKIERAHALSR